MPGMMDTILNVGLNDESVDGLARSTGNEEFARDCYRRLIQMFGETVDGIPHESFSVDDSVERAREIYERETGQGFPQDAREQLHRAITAVFESWNSSRAQVYRHMYGIPDDLGTAVNVVQMVFGNKGDDSATGVCFTRDPSTGEQGVYGEYLVNAQGEDVVAGTRTPQPLAELRKQHAGGVRRSSSRRWARSSATTATCRTSSSPSRRGGSTSSRRAPRSGRRRPRSSAPST